jgi:hypothetical protein
MRSAVRSSLACLVVLLLGCGEGAADRAGAPTFEGAPSAVLTTDSGRLVLSVWTWPAPLARGVAAVRLRVTDTEGAPVDGATLAATPWMPAHGHGASVLPTVTGAGDGAYDVDPVLLYMSGRWELRTRIDAPGAPAEDTAVVPLDVR